MLFYQLLTYSAKETLVNSMPKVDVENIKDQYMNDGIN